jgi:hypothetical protein
MILTLFYEDHSQAGFERASPRSNYRFNKTHGVASLSIEIAESRCRQKSTDQLPENGHQTGLKL